MSVPRQEPSRSLTDIYQIHLLLVNPEDLTKMTYSHIWALKKIIIKLKPDLKPVGIQKARRKGCISVGTAAALSRQQAFCISSATSALTTETLTRIRSDPAVPAEQKLKQTSHSRKETPDRDKWTADGSSLPSAVQEKASPSVNSVRSWERRFLAELDVIRDFLNCISELPQKNPRFAFKLRCGRGARGGGAVINGDGTLVRQPPSCRPERQESAARRHQFSPGAAGRSSLPSEERERRRGRAALSRTRRGR